MKTVYDLYHWTTPNAAAEIRHGGLDHMNAAAMEAGHPNPAAWRRVPNDNGWLLNEALTGGRREWGIFERRLAETDAERIELSLDVIHEFAQTDGAHHKAWVLDQVVRILTGDGYDAWVTEYCGGEDGPDTYSWDEGIAP